MDLNKAFSAHQIAVIRASAASLHYRQQRLSKVANHIADHIAWYQGLISAPCARLLAAETLRLRPSAMTDKQLG